MIRTIINDLFLPLKKQLNQSQKLFVFAFFLMSIDGFPFLPVHSDNRPVSIIVIIIYWIIEKILKNRFSKMDLKIFGVFFIFWLYCFYKAGYYYHDYSGLIKFTITGIFSSITISSCITFYQGLLQKYSYDVVIQIVCNVIIIGSITPILLGIVQFLALKGLFPMIIADTITNFFSYRPLLDRVQMFNTEASHASNYMVLVFIFIFSFFHQNKLRTQFLIITFLSIILIGSTIGYVVLVLTLLIYWFFYVKKKILNTLKYIGLMSIIIFILILLSSYFINEYTKSKFEIVSELLSLNFETLQVIASVDFSTYDRIFSPILGFLSLNDTFYFGTGGESFFYIYDFLLYKYFPFALDNPVLKSTLDEGIILTIKFLPAKIAAELGIVPFILFILFFINIFVRLRKLYKLTNNANYQGLSLIMIYAIISTWACSYFNFSFIMIVTLAYTVIKIKTDKIL